MPTAEQAIQAVILCHWLSNLFQSINVFRYDSRFKTIYIQAGERDGIAVVISSDGRWEFEQ